MKITVYCGSTFGINAAFEEAAQALGREIAQAGYTLVYGGSSVGLMGVVSRAALEAGGIVEGVEPQFFIDAGVAQHDLSSLFIVETMSERKALMIELGDVFVALPGGIGTLEEISEIMSRVRLGLGPDRCYVLNIGGFYEPFKDLLDAMVTQRFLDAADLEVFHFCESVEELMGLIKSHSV